MCSEMPHVKQGSHSFTCHPHTNRTCLYSPAAGCHRPLTGTHCAYSHRDGRVELTWVADYIPRLMSRTRNWTICVPWSAHPHLQIAELSTWLRVCRLGPRSQCLKRCWHGFSTVPTLARNTCHVYCSTFDCHCCRQSISPMSLTARWHLALYYYSGNFALLICQHTHLFILSYIKPYDKRDVLFDFLYMWCWLYALILTNFGWNTSYSFECCKHINRKNTLTL